MQTDYLVYEHWRTDTNTCFYVGKGQFKRAHNMSTRSERHRRITAKLRREGHEVVVKIVTDRLPEESAFALEKMRISYWRALGVGLINFTDGGEGQTGLKHTKAARRKMSEGRKGPLNHNFGKRHSDETRAKIAEKARGRRMSAEQKALRREQNSGENNPMYGVRRTGWKHKDETRTKMSAAQSGEQHAFYGRKHTPETLEKIAAGSRAYWARKRAEKELGGTAASVAR